MIMDDCIGYRYSSIENGAPTPSSANFICAYYTSKWDGTESQTKPTFPQIEAVNSSSAFESNYYLVSLIIITGIKVIRADGICIVSECGHTQNERSQGIEEKLKSFAQK